MAKIYKIYNPNEPETPIYVGSTTSSLCERFSKHKYDFINNKTSTMSHILFQEYADDLKIELLEECSIDERHIREQFYINNTNCINLRNAPSGLSGEEYRKRYYAENYEKIRNNQKIHYEQNKDAINSRNIKYQLEHRDDILQYKHNYYMTNKERMTEQMKEYRKNNKEKMYSRAGEKIECECGKTVRRSGISKHKKTVSHQTWEQSQHLV